MSAADYQRFTTKAMLDKSVNELLGIFEGVSLDGVINFDEMKFLSAWLDEHRQYQKRHPFTEIIPVLADALIDNELTQDERENIIWLCEKLRSSEFYDEVAADLQRLQGIMSAVAADGLVSLVELSELTDWLAEHEHLRTRYPFDELDALLIDVMRDRKISPDENKLLLSFLGDFSNFGTAAGAPGTPTLQALFAVDPQITFRDARFCFTGDCANYSRDEMSAIVIQRGGKVVSGISKVLNYLVVGSQGNPYWKYACYGRKVEQALALRKSGAPIVIVHENDFRDAIVD
jgi:hypothetical protein